MTAPLPDRVTALLAAARAALAGLEASNPAQEARELLEWATGTDSVWAVAEPVEPSIAARVLDAAQERARGVPLQHLTGSMHFRGLVLASRPGVFVCRPETEVVAGFAIDEGARVMKERGSAVLVDLCTGSGAIAVALAREVPGASVAAVELDPTALALAGENLARLAPGVRLEAGDATSPTTLVDLDGSVDVVCSNPPYVPALEAPTQIEAGLDPDLALYGGGDKGIEVPRCIIARASRLLRPGGLLVLEHSPSQSALLRDCAREAGFETAETRADLAGRERCLLARRATMPE